MSSRDEEPARRRKHRHSDIDSSTRSRDKNPNRIRSSKTSHKKRPKSKERLHDDAERSRPRSSRSHQSQPTMSLVPELNRRPAKASPYPEFSKAHSKESLEPDASRPTARAPITPDPTDLGKKTRDGRASPRPPSAAARHAATAPPSPPLTADEPDLRRRGSGNSMRRSGGSARSDGRESGRASATGRRSADPESQREAGTKTSHSSLRKATAVDEESEISGSSKPSTAVRAKGARSSNVTRSATHSNATSIAPDPPRVRKASNSSPSVVDSSPRTPNSTQQIYPSPEMCQKGTPMVEVFASPASRMSEQFGNNAAPPPPPPPPMMPPDIPRVDYLLNNGGLAHTVPRALVAASEHSSPNGVRPPPSETVQHIFAPFRNLLDDYTQVMSKSGSIAVATGYRSVARRLLDRLEAVFARNISSETCRCVMCCANLDLHAPTEEDTGVSWGEILEFVSGRRELPAWPPFCIETVSAGLGISGMGQAAPMQKLDIDVPDEYREHYIKQSKKTKQAVQNWLASQPHFPSSPPQAVDDETLTFAMVTHLDPEKRPIFTALLQGKATIGGSRAGTPLNGSKPKSEILTKTALALQRLYRLESGAPRDPECAIFLLNHPELHGVLATMAAISQGEWDILVSGRFDGFLWSGAEGPIPPPSYGTPSISASRGPSRGPAATPLSRTTTPFSAGAPSRGTTPFSPGARNGTPGLGPAFGRTTPGIPSSFGAPVQMDEEVEIATLAEVEREIYLGMEALEDAFEALHCKAEVVRRALRERGAGLAIAAQARRGSEGVEVRLGTPASNAGGWNGQGWDTETDDGIDDGISELAPDDSASNISYNRRRRGGRQKERKTPAPVVEEDESDFTAEVGGRRRR